MTNAVAEITILNTVVVKNWEYRGTLKKILDCIKRRIL